MEPAHSGWSDPRVPELPGLNLAGGLAYAADLLAAAYGWTRAQVWDLDLGTIQRHVALIQRRQFDADLAHRRLETAKLRTLCTFIAAGIPLTEGAENVMLIEAQRLSLGTGTQATDEPAVAAPAPLPAPAPVAAIAYDQLPDAPPSVRVGQPAPIPDGVRILPLHKLGQIFGGDPS